MLQLKPITFTQTCDFINRLHRHHKKPQGWKFGIACYDGEKLVGVCVVGRPVARHLDNGVTAEVTRLCTDGSYNACSMLYAAAWRAAKAMGYKRMITYILANERGTSLRASGWQLLYKVNGRSWSAPSRPRNDKHPICDKCCFGIGDIEKLRDKEDKKQPFSEVIK